MTEATPLLQCPWCSCMEQHTDPWGTCARCRRPWLLKDWQVHHFANATASEKAMIGQMLLASIATPELESAAVEVLARNGGKGSLAIPVGISIGWILKARALLK